MTGKDGPHKVEDLPMSVVVPGFILSELRTGFQMGFLLFIPFILIDFVVAIVLMSLGLFLAGYDFHAVEDFALCPRGRLDAGQSLI